MPNPGQVNNGAGVNGLYDPEAPYGTIKRLEQTVKATGTPSTPALSAPKRAQKAAVNQPAQAAQPVQTPADYHAEVARAYAYYASLPGASPLVLEYAARAARQVNSGSK